MIALVNYGAGNIRSVTKAMEASGADVKVTESPEDVFAADKVVLPGVGAFGKAVEALEKRKLVEPLRKVIREGKPFLGICLGAQLLFESSEENPGVEGLGVLPGKVVRFPAGLKVPHLGWNQVSPKKDHFIWADVPEDSYFYFAHSYYFAPANPEHVLGETEYSHQYASIVGRDNITGIQFHPEKSQKWGLKILENFIKQ
jgi:glutamine amidotransferase